MRKSELEFGVGAFGLNRRTVLRALGGAGAIAVTAPAWANDDEALYDPAPPADSAYIRLVAGGASESVSIGAAIFPAGDAPRIEAYRILPAGKYAVSGAASGEVTLTAGSSYSYLIGGSTAAGLSQDEIVGDPAKCGLMLFNLSDAPAARLYVPGRDIEILGGVETGAQKTRAVNALTVDLAVGPPDAETARFPNVKLRRRSHVSFLLAGSAGDYAAVMARNSVS